MLSISLAFAKRNARNPKKASKTLVRNPGKSSEKPEKHQKTLGNVKKCFGKKSG